MQFYVANKDNILLYFYNACLVPYKVYECHPDLLKIEKSLQVICSQKRCHPIWIENFRNSSLPSGGESSDFLFKNAFSVHYTYPEPSEFASMETLLENQNASFMAEIAVAILKTSGILYNKN